MFTCPIPCGRGTNSGGKFPFPPSLISLSLISHFVFEVNLGSEKGTVPSYRPALLPQTRARLAGSSVLQLSNLAHFGEILIAFLFRSLLVLLLQCHHHHLIRMLFYFLETRAADC